MQNSTGERMKTWNFGVEWNVFGQGVTVAVKVTVGRIVGCGVDVMVGVDMGRTQLAKKMKKTAKNIIPFMS